MIPTSSEKVMVDLGGDDCNKGCMGITRLRATVALSDSCRPLTGEHACHPTGIENFEDLFHVIKADDCTASLLYLMTRGTFKYNIRDQSSTSPKFLFHFMKFGVKLLSIENSRLTGHG